MKIAMFTETYLPNLDGVVRSIVSLREKLEERGHEVYIFTAGGLSDKKKNKDKRVFYHLGSPFLPYPQYKVAIFPFLAQNKVHKLGIDVIHTHGMAMMGLAALETKIILGKPMLGTFHTLITESPFYILPIKRLYPFVKKITWNYIKWYFNQCEVVACPSHIIEHSLAEHGLKKTVVLPNGVDTVLFSPNNFDLQWRQTFAAQKNKIILYVGRLAKEKNIMFLPDIAKKMDDEYVFVVIGDGPLRKGLERSIKASRLSDRFFLLVKVSDETVRKAYASSDALIFPSTFETQGLVAVEAMASGLPVVGAKAYGISEVIKHNETGYLVDPEDINDYAEYLKLAVQNRQELSIKCREHVEKNYSLEKSVNDYVRLYERLNKFKN